MVGVYGHISIGAWGGTKQRAIWYVPCGTRVVPLIGVRAGHPNTPRRASHKPQRLVRPRRRCPSDGAARRAGVVMCDRLCAALQFRTVLVLSADLGSNPPPSGFPWTRRPLEWSINEVTDNVLDEWPISRFEAA